MRDLREREFIDSLWKYEGVFNHDLHCTYADRCAGDARRQEVGLSPTWTRHGRARRIDPAIKGVEHIFDGDGADTPLRPRTG